MINPTSKPNDLDKSLKKDWGYGLLNFAHVLAEVLIESALGDYQFGKKSSIDSLIAKSEKIKKDTIDGLRGYLIEYLLLDPVAFPKFKRMKAKKEEENYIKRKFKLKHLYDMLDALNAPLKDSIESMEENLKSLKGRHVIKKK